MKHFILILFTISIYTLGYTQQTIVDSIWHNDSCRHYIQYIPANYNSNQPVPMILSLHPYGGLHWGQFGRDNFRHIADTAGFIIVYPQGLVNKKDTVSHWNVGEWIGDSEDDTGFLSALIDSVSIDYNIDTNRIYATGFSNGGYMSFHLACHLSNRIAAIASVAASMTFHTYNTCNPQRPVPILQIHGTEDPAVHLEGNSWSVAISNIIQYWVNQNSCKAQPTTSSFPDVDPSNGVTVNNLIYNEGNSNVSVEYLKIIGGDHTWSGLKDDAPNKDLNTSIEIWKFLSKYDINGFIGNTGTNSINNTNNLHSNIIGVYPNPAETQITLELNNWLPVDKNNPETIEIFSMQGHMVKSIRLIDINQKTIDFDINELENGLYILRFNRTCIKFSVVK